jgi:quercetin dioxygenase-like cupin family protein
LEIVRKPPTNKGPADRFVGDVWVDIIATGRGPAPMRVNFVRFAPGARNAWHAHAHGQTLHVTDGRGLVQARGETAVEINPGDTIYAPPGEWHWHGAMPDHFMTHLAMWQAPDEGAESDWADQISDEEYAAAAASARPAIGYRRDD